jgi:transcriptional regulator CtsR
LSGILLGGEETEMHGGDGGETGMMHMQVKDASDCWQLYPEKSMRQNISRSLQKKIISLTLDFRLLAYKTVRMHFCCLSYHNLWQPQGTTRSKERYLLNCGFMLSAHPTPHTRSF